MQRAFSDVDDAAPPHIPILNSRLHGEVYEICSRYIDSSPADRCDPKMQDDSIEESYPFSPGLHS